MQSNLLGYHNTDDGGWRIADPKVEGRVKVEDREKKSCAGGSRKHAGSPPTM